MNTLSVTVGLRFNAADTARFDDLARETPKAFRSAVGRAFSILRRNIIKVMSGESSTYIPALAPWHPLTRRITSVRKFGGVLADSSKIRVFKKDDVVQVGWLPKMEGAARAWQEPGEHATTKDERKRLHIILNKLGEKNHSIIPLVYRRPKRDVINTLADRTSDKITGWIAGAYEREIQRQMKKGWVTA